MAKSAMMTGRAAGEVELNVVPLVDVCCLLILFFILTTTISSASYAALEVPSVTDSNAKKMGGEEKDKRVLVNIMCRVNPRKPEADPADTMDAKEYKIEGVSFPCDPNEVTTDQAVERLTTEFQKRASAAIKDGKVKNVGEFGVEIRGDQRVMAESVLPILQAAAKAGMSKVYITALE